MNFITEHIPEEGRPDAKFIYADFHQVLDWMQFPTPDPHISLNLRVLQGNKHKDWFIIEYLPLGRMDYDITAEDTWKACDYAQVVAKRNIPTWFDCKDPEIEIMYPHERVIEQYTAKVNAAIALN